VGRRWSLRAVRTRRSARRRLYRMRTELERDPWPDVWLSGERGAPHSTGRHYVAMLRGGRALASEASERLQNGPPELGDTFETDSRTKKPCE